MSSHAVGPIPLTSGAPALSSRRAPTGALISPLADAILVVGSPLIAFALTWAVATFGSETLQSQMSLAVAVLIGAHLIVTLVHTHGNPAVFRTHPWRFTIVPLIVLIVLAASPALLVLATVVLVVWDVHHSGMQTFGLMRLYERKAGADPARGRWLDLVLNQLLYAGPIVAGAGLLVHVHSMGKASPRVIAFVTDLNTRFGEHFMALRIVLLTLGVTLAFVRVAACWRRKQRGEPVSCSAAALLVTTGLASVLSWSVLPFGLALVAMKLFHCVQYFTLVAVVERKQVAAWFLPARSSVPLPIVAGALLVPALIFGAWTQYEAHGAGSSIGLALILTVTFAHFWYDGFTWSVRANAIPTHGTEVRP